MNTETITLTAKEFLIMQWVDAQSYIDDYADRYNAADTMHGDDLTPEQFEIEHQHATQFVLTETSLTFVRDCLAMRHIAFGIEGLSLRPYGVTPAERRTVRRLLQRIGTVPGLIEETEDA